MNPLVEGDRQQAFRLLYQGLPRLLAEPDNAALRIDLCTAALLENRAADDGVERRRTRDRTSSSTYALATALHIRYHHVGQGEATAALLPTVTRATPPEEREVAARIARALDVWQETMSAPEAAAATAGALEAFYGSLGMPIRLHQLHIPQEELPLLAQDTLKNFNANPGVRSAGYADEMLQLLQAAW